jgi:hypothetical protein
LDAASGDQRGATVRSPDFAGSRTPAPRPRIRRGGRKGGGCRRPSLLTRMVLVGSTDRHDRPRNSGC